MKEYGYIRVGAVVPELKVANTNYNTQEIIKQIKDAAKKDIDIVSFPELSITGYTCGDLFLQDLLLNKVLDSLKLICNETKNLDIISIVGAPIRSENQIFNCGVVIASGKIIGIVPKTYIPNYSEFYEKRWFASSHNKKENYIEIDQEKIPFTTNIIFEDKNDKTISFAIEICEDLWCNFPPSSSHTLNGASIIFNLSSSNEIVGKYEYRKNLVKMQSAKTIGAYIYTSSGVNESTTDVLFSGHAMIYENGTLLKENKRFDFHSNIIYEDIDIMKMMNNRYRDISYMGVVTNSDYIRVKIDIKNKKKDIIRKYSPYPFVPNDSIKRKERCEEIFHIQASALAKRLKHTKIDKCVIGISGGLDSTLAFLVIVEAFKKLGIDNKNIIAITMPGFGTTNRTYTNAVHFIKSYHATLKEINIKEACLVHFKDIDHDVNKHDITYENTQARERTQILMDVANKENALVIGTGDLSELALGWCTYNGDHMSMYAVNASIPKTLVRYLVEYVALNENNKLRKQTILDILDTPISPELLPPDKNGKITQLTENSVGPYVLHDFFLYHFLRYGASPKKIYFIAKNTFQDYSEDEILKWLKFFIKRFFTQQFKRSCIPDGVKVGTISLSPRGDLRMPSDSDYTDWLNDINS